MANMSGKDTYINSTDERDNGTEPSGYGSTTSSERGNTAAPERSNATTSERNGGGAPSEHGNASPSEHDNTAAMQRDANGAAVSSECDNATSPQHSSAVSPERSGNASPEHSDAIHGPKHAASAGEEAVDSSSHAEETSSDDRSGALTAKAASGESRGSHAAKAASDKDRGSHAAKAISGEDHAAHAKEIPSAYLKKAGDFLGLHKKASAIAAAIALCVVVGIGAAVASSSRPTPNGIPLSSGFVSYAANAVATTTDAAADEAAAGLVAQRLTPDALNGIDSFATAPGTFSLMEGEDAASLSEEQ